MSGGAPLLNPHGTDAGEYAAEVQAYAKRLDIPVEEVVARDRRRRLRESRDPAELLPGIRETLALEVELLRVVKTDADPAHYRIETSSGDVRLGTAVRWMNRQGEFRTAFVDQIGDSPARLRGEHWDELCGMVARAAEVEDVGEEATDAGLGRAWLREYLRNRPAVDEYDDTLGGEHHCPVRRGGRLHVFGADLRRWLYLGMDERPSHARFGEVLRAAGCEPGRLDLIRDGRRTQQRTWVVPESLL